MKTGLRILLGIAASALSVSQAFAAGISISPLKFEFDTLPGTESSGIIKVMNDTGKPVVLYATKEDFVAGDDAGTPTFVKPQEQGSDEFSLSNWIQVEDKNFTLAQGETREVRFSVKAPANAEPGGHYGAVFFSAAPEKGQVSVVGRIGALVLVDVPGETKVSGNLADFESGISPDGKAFDPKADFSTFPIAFSTRFKNEGNVHLKPVGKIELIDENGEPLKGVGKETLSTPGGAFVGEKLVDYVPVNDGLGNVLPNSERRFLSKWEGFGYPVVGEDGTKTVKFKSLSEYYADKAAEKKQYLKFYESVRTRTVDRKITANLTLAYEAKDASKKEFKDSKTFTVRYEEQYVGVDYAVVLIVLALASGIGYYAFVAVPRSRERLRKELLEQVRKGGKEE